MAKTKSVIISMAIIAIAVSAVTIIKAVCDGTSVADETTRSNQETFNAAKNGDVVQVKQVEQPVEKSTSAADQIIGLNQEMIIAASDGNLEKVKQLVDKGADINAVSKHNFSKGNTSLTLASQYGHLEVVKFLVEKGADVNVVTSGDVILGVTALHLALTNKHLDIVKFLVGNGADVNASAVGELGGGAIALRIASANGNLDIVKLLVDNGADVNAVINNSYGKGETALMAAALTGHLEIVKFLVENGADINAIATVGSKVFTALTIASELGHSDVVKFLVENGADIAAVSQEGKTSQGSDIESDNAEVSDELKHDKVKSNVETSIDLKKKIIDLGGDITMEFVYIPAGEFMMGSPSDPNMGLLGYKERPQHKVKISKGFWMGVCEVTHGQYQQFVKESNDDGVREANAAYLMHFKNNTQNAGLKYPVCWVSWNNACAFCEWLSVKEGKTYRLPTEAEWEYSCRAGRTTELDIKDDGLFLNSSGGRALSMRGTHPAGQNKPNPFGLYDMYDNVREWCRDWYGSYSDTSEVDPEGPSSGDKRVVRGDYSGSIISYRCAKRYSYSPDKPDNAIGFRIICEDSE